MPSRTVADCGDRRLRRDAGRWILPRNIEDAFARVGISAILRPAVFLTLADSAGLLKDTLRPSFQREDRWRLLLRHQH